MCTFFYELEDIFGSRVSECAAIEDTMTAEYLNVEGAVETLIAVPIEEPKVLPKLVVRQVRAVRAYTAERGFRK